MKLIYWPLLSLFTTVWWFIQFVDFVIFLKKPELEVSQLNVCKIINGLKTSHQFASQCILKEPTKIKLRLTSLHVTFFRFTNYFQCNWISLKAWRYQLSEKLPNILITQYKISTTSQTTVINMTHNLSTISVLFIGFLLRFA